MLFLDRSTRACDMTSHRAGSQLKKWLNVNSWEPYQFWNFEFLKLWNFWNFEILKFWNFYFLNAILGTCLATFVFMSILKSRCLKLKMSMVFLDTITLPCEFANPRAGSQLKIGKNLYLDDER